MSGQSLADGDVWKSILSEYVTQDPAFPLVVVLGPTASGKTDLSLEIAAWLTLQGRGAEVVNADSRQLYRFLDIGTAKISEPERRGVPHHLFDVLDPSEEATAPWFKRESERTIQEIHARGHIPLLVGGSMLYLSAVIDNLDFVETADPTLRAQLEDEYDTDDGVSLHRRLREVDPSSAASIHRHNKPYVVRAAEIAFSTGKPASAAKTKRESPYDLLVLGVDRDRDDLVRRIETRTAQLLRNGWIGEVESLLARGYTPKDPGMKSHGYREIMAYLRDPEALSPDELAELINRKTRAYAKRQRTWWKDDDRIRWIRPG